jgi:hypothetical protein
LLIHSSFLCSRRALHRLRDQCAAQRRRVVERLRPPNAYVKSLGPQFVGAVYVLCDVASWLQVGLAIVSLVVSLIALRRSAQNANYIQMLQAQFVKVEASMRSYSTGAGGLGGAGARGGDGGSITLR